MAYPDKESTILRRAFGKAPPEKITQEPFDHDDGHLRRLVGLHPDDKPKPADLWEYVQDVRHTDIQGSLLNYLLPFCLEAWREDLRGTSSEYGGFVEHLYPLLADGHIFDTHLSSRQTAAVSDFMRQGILDEIDDQRGLSYQGAGARPYRWIGALTTYGVVLPDINLLWAAWWSQSTIGRAVAALQYISCLMYPETENPVFAAWTAESGGGPPCLWEFEGHLYQHRWLEANINSLRSVLSVTIVSGTIEQAYHRLAAEPEGRIASEIQADFPLLTTTLEARCAELPKLLATPNQARPLNWTV